jgi:hypothetical protein
MSPRRQHRRIIIIIRSMMMSSRTWSSRAPDAHSAACPLTNHNSPLSFDCRGTSLLPALSSSLPVTAPLFSAPDQPVSCCKTHPASPYLHLQSTSLVTIMAGRGRGRTLPAWMTDDAAPGSAPAAAPSFSAPAPASSASASSPPLSAAQSSNVAVAPPPQRQAPPGMMPGDDDYLPQQL